MNELDIASWFAERRLPYKPDHFIVSNTPINSESQLWIYSKLQGRFCLVHKDQIDDIWTSSIYPAFENPHEAIFYELTWS